MSLNRVVLTGRLTRDADLRYTPNGVAVANFTIAVDNPFDKNKDADFINVVVWRKAAENTANFTRKGSLVGVDGRLQSRSYDNQEGKRQFVTEVVADSVQFLESKGKQEQPNNQQKDDDPFSEHEEINSDSLPF